MAKEKSKLHSAIGKTNVLDLLSTSVHILKPTEDVPLGDLDFQGIFDSMCDPT